MRTLCTGQEGEKGKAAVGGAKERIERGKSSRQAFNVFKRRHRVTPQFADYASGVQLEQQYYLKRRSPPPPAQYQKLICIPELHVTRHLGFANLNVCGNSESCPVSPICTGCMTDSCGVIPALYEGLLAQ